MSFKMYTGQRDEEYELMDSIVEEQYEIGGTTAWIYAYLGPRGNKDSTDATKPDYETLGSKITDIGNYVWMETPDRKYSVDAISMPVVYQVQEGNMDMQIPGLFLFDTMDITMPYNMMVSRLGRKLMNGDVIELANLREFDPLDDEKECMNRFYVVHDAFKTARGYSHTWFSHIWTIRVVPLVDSPEFKDILGGKDDPLKKNLSVADREKSIMDLIVGQADSEVPYMHWDNEHIHKFNQMPPISSMMTGFSFPNTQTDGLYFALKSLPRVYEFGNTGSWIEVPALMPDSNAQLDGDFAWRYSERDGVTLELTQYYADTNKCVRVYLDEFDKLPEAATASGFCIVRAEKPAPYQYSTEKSTWVPAKDEYNVDTINNKHNQQDRREKLPPMSKIKKGNQFPQEAKEGTWFLRIDVTPETLWKFENNTWRMFNYGGRFAWTGTDDAKSTFVNKRDTYDQNGTQVPSKQNIADVLKPNIDD